MINELTYIFEILTTFAGFFSTYLILKKGSKVLCNRLMAVATSLIGFYTIFILLYDLIQELWAIEVFLRFAMFSILLATMFVFFSMICMIYSSAWFQRPLNWIPYVIAVLAYSIYLVLTDLLTVIEYHPVNVSINLIPLFIMVLLLLFFLISSLIILGKFGLKKTEGLSRKKMEFFAVGLTTCLLSIFINIISQIFSDTPAGSILDLVFFFLLACGVLIATFGFLIEEKNGSE